MDKTAEQIAEERNVYRLQVMLGEALAEIERQAAQITALRTMLEQAEDDWKRACTIIDRVRATVGTGQAAILQEQSNAD